MARCYQKELIQGCKLQKKLLSRNIGSFFGRMFLASRETVSRPERERGKNASNENSFCTVCLPGFISDRQTRKLPPPMSTLAADKVNIKVRPNCFFTRPKPTFISLIHSHTLYVSGFFSFFPPGTQRFFLIR